jgi:hypothetical protein
MCKRQRVLPTTTVDGVVRNVRIYDNNGKSFDRFTAVFMDEPERERGVYAAVAMSKYPYSPQGFGQHCSARTGRHLGKRIAFEDLPADCQSLVRQDLAEEVEP